ncbi:MAG: M48 family metallopeptidase [Pseudohongiellaceae bacterium]
MNFFESQDIAKRNTGRLIMLFALAVLSLILVTNLIVMLALGFSAADTTDGGGFWARFDWNTFLLISGGVLAVILFGSLYKTSSLRGGGASVAEMMNGRLLQSNTSDPDEARVLNVVQEMAIASGTPVPPVYLMEEQGINAFAAGYSPSDAVIGVTRGAIQNLSRDELQGVIAHEFSHILHGDMRINIRLIGVLHGILILGILGYYLLRGGVYGRRSKNAGGIMALALGLMVVGFVGTFFGNLIKAAVSRQREFLADASAVQFTRNPDGIGGALMRIATHSNRSYMDNAHTTEISHALFEEGLVSPLSRLYATHPPLEKRIRAILPDWDGNFERAPLTKSQDPHEQTGREAAAREDARRREAAAILAGTTGLVMAEAAIDRIGTPGPEAVGQAHVLLQRLPAKLLDAVHEPSAARAVVYGLVIERDEVVRGQQLDFLRAEADAGVYEELARLLPLLQDLEPDLRLPLINLALTSLRQLSLTQYQLFRRNYVKLVELDQKIGLFEWALQKIVFHHLDVVFGGKAVPSLGRRELGHCGEACAVVFSLLVYASTQQGISEAEAFDSARVRVGSPKIGLISRDKLNFNDLNAALERLKGIKPLQKPLLLKACAAAIAADRNINPLEIELLRAVAETLDCPMPPMTAPN